MTSVVITSKIGNLCLTQENNFLTGCQFTHKKATNKALTPLLESAIREVNEYLLGKRQEFSIPLYTSGTVFQERVWKNLLNIPYGETRNYAQISAAMGIPRASRAVGSANARNPLCVFIPCHRLIRMNGEVGKYAGGSQCKKLLLQLEASMADSAAVEFKD